MAIASRWRELSGENYWEGLLRPLDIDLRRYLIHYCQRAGAAGDAFNGTRASKAADEVAYFGYVAVATDQGKAALGRRDILVSWRGTITHTECMPVFNIYTKSIANSPYAKTSAREQVCKVLQQLITMYQNEEVSITVTGHSLGAALASLNAMDIAHNGFNKPAGNPNKAFMSNLLSLVGEHGLEGHRKLKPAMETPWSKKSRHTTNMVYTNQPISIHESLQRACYYENPNQILRLVEKQS
ncbi:phospholipase A1-IIgamma-like [Hibiscus syriacus]|uniref:phospholipase A1-IIgamma-like n=1 Tax=Hibiscus syriacus TaxID=106335 RepID=UPI001921548D|nr:phospholipase A1-IIgamma-like [Hibiscus syriacus]XP_039020065.1 phospholipase A1-IIgamma-like [Hibiscus syriacus]